eukprot:766020-Hanusia_phi.AAC.1
MIESEEGGGAAGAAGAAARGSSPGEPGTRAGPGWPCHRAAARPGGLPGLGPSVRARVSLTGIGWYRTVLSDGDAGVRVPAPNRSRRTVRYGCRSAGPSAAPRPGH